MCVLSWMSLAKNARRQCKRGDGAALAGRDSLCVR